MFPYSDVREVAVAWVEQVGYQFRVRFRDNGQIITDSTHADGHAAKQRCQGLEASQQRRRRLYEPAPAPKLSDWVKVWSAHRLVSLAAAKRDESLLRVHILPRFGRWRLSAIDLLAVQAFVNDLRQDLAYESVRSILLLLRGLSGRGYP